jgi:hypothetical protein
MRIASFRTGDPGKLTHYYGCTRLPATVITATGVIRWAEQLIRDPALLRLVSEGVYMSQLSQIVGQLQIQRKQVQSELSRLDAAIDALRGLNASNGSGTIVASPRRTLSAAGRRAISLAQKARWAKRAAKSNAAATTKPKRTMSAAARQKIAAAQKARWAVWKAKQKKAA